MAELVTLISLSFCPDLFLHTRRILDEPVLCCFHRFIVLTTSAGIMDHEEARRKHTGGKILGFFF